MKHTHLSSTLLEAVDLSFQIRHYACEITSINGDSVNFWSLTKRSLPGSVVFENTLKNGRSSVETARVDVLHSPTSPKQTKSLFTISFHLLSHFSASHHFKILLNAFFKGNFYLMIPLISLLLLICIPFLSLSKTVKTLKCFPMCKLRSKPARVSWMLTGDLRLPGKRWRTVFYSWPLFASRRGSVIPAHAVGCVTGEEPWVEGSQIFYNMR